MSVERRGLVAGVLLAVGASCAQLSSDGSATDRSVPPELKEVIGDGVGLDRLVTLTRELGATSEFLADGLGFQVMPGQIFQDGFAVNYVFFHRRPLFEIQSIYDKQKALELWGDVEVRFLEERQGGYQIGIAVSDVPRAGRHVQALGLTEHTPLGSPAQVVFEGTQDPFANKSAVLLAEDLPPPYQYVEPVYFTNYTHVARESGRERRPEDRHPALHAPHPNTAAGIAAVYLAVDDLESAVAAYRDLGFTRLVLGEHEPWGARWPATRPDVGPASSSLPGSRATSTSSS